MHQGGRDRKMDQGDRRMAVTIRRWTKGGRTADGPRHTRMDQGGDRRMDQGRGDRRMDQEDGRMLGRDRRWSRVARSGG